MFSDPQPGHEYSRFFGIYVEILQMWTSRQQNEVLNIVQAKKYPEVPTFWTLFCRPKMAEISNLLSHFNAMCPDEGYNLLGAFESALCRSNHFVFSKRLLSSSGSLPWIAHCTRLTAPNNTYSKGYTMDYKKRKAVKNYFIQIQIKVQNWPVQTNLVIFKPHVCLPSFVWSSLKKMRFR